MAEKYPTTWNIKFLNENFSIPKLDEYLQLNNHK
jgi:hypothetical protein